MAEKKLKVLKNQKKSKKRKVYVPKICVPKEVQAKRDEIRKTWDDILNGVTLNSVELESIHRMIPMMAEASLSGGPAFIFTENPIVINNRTLLHEIFPFVEFVTYAERIEGVDIIEGYNGIH